MLSAVALLTSQESEACDATGFTQGGQVRGIRDGEHDGGWPDRHAASG
jgi:hypothetical protein